MLFFANTVDGRVARLTFLFALLGPIAGLLIVVGFNLLSNGIPLGEIGMSPLILIFVGYAFGSIPAALTGLTLGLLDNLWRKASRDMLLAFCLGAWWTVAYFRWGIGRPCSGSRGPLTLLPETPYAEALELALWGGLSGSLTAWAVRLYRPANAQVGTEPRRGDYSKLN